MAEIHGWQQILSQAGREMNQYVKTELVAKKDMYASHKWRVRKDRGYGHRQDLFGKELWQIYDGTGDEGRWRSLCQVFNTWGLQGDAFRLTRNRKLWICGSEEEKLILKQGDVKRKQYFRIKCACCPVKGLRFHWWNVKMPLVDTRGHSP